LRALPAPYGRLTLQALVDFFFQDIEDRLRALLGPKISERTITGYMKEYRELWNGSTFALDVGSVWRNCFDARGWDLGGIRGDDGEPVSNTGSTPTLTPTSPSTLPLGDYATGPSTGGTPVKRLDAELIDMPLHIYTFVAYLRRELERLENIPDETIIEEMDVGQWGKMEGAESGDDVKREPISKAEMEKWTKVWEEIGTYR